MLVLIYQHIKINLHHTDQLLELYELGIPLDHYQKNKDNTLDIVLSTSEKNILVQNGINFQVIQDDLTNYYLLHLLVISGVKINQESFWIILA